MAGHMGTEKVTVQNLRLVEVRDNATNANQKILAIAGAVPGARGAYVYIRKAVKMAGKPAAKTN
jgi:large subunit ribosomal protein L3